MNQKRFLVIILFILLLFSFSTFALIPGDFNADGKVDFEDLMIFALAYGSTPTDDNWNPSCDLHPDSKIDFEDLMLFAMHYGEAEATDHVHNITQGTYHHTIQEAIDAAGDEDIIVVNAWTYPENLLFSGKNITVRSLNPQELNYVMATVIDGGGKGSVVTFTDGDTSTLLGFTIRNGYTTEIGKGGGISMDNSSPTIQNNIITDNKADYGGGIRVNSKCFPTIIGNEINGNEAGIGGGIFVSAGTDFWIYNSSPTITGNIIIGNKADNWAGGIYVYNSSSTITGNIIEFNEADAGGGIFLGYNTGVGRLPPTITDNTISDNKVVYGGGGIYVHYHCNPIITGNHITENEANKGGGIYVYDHCSPDIQNNSITDNTSTYGGGIYVERNCYPTINGNTITTNTSYYGGGIYLYGGITIGGLATVVSPNIQNNNITANQAYYDGGGLCLGADSSPTVQENDITENTAGLLGGGIWVHSGGSLFPDDPRPTGWDTDRRKIPSLVMVGEPLYPPEGEEYMIAGNKLLGNEQGTGYTEGAHVYFE